MFTKNSDLLPLYAKGRLGIRMQSALDSMFIRKDDVGASSVRLYVYARDLAKPLEYGANVGFDGMRRQTRQ